MTKQQLVTLGKVLAAPRRVDIIEMLRKRKAPVSPMEAAKELGDGLSQISYHFTVLRDCEAVTLADTKPRRGAIEHFYRLSTDSAVAAALLSLIGRAK